jgi:parvulin-like peptidyl-prolyl isomerase
VKRALALVACCVLFGAACSKSDRPAATVNGAKLTNNEVVDELKAITGNGDYLAAVESEVSAGGLKVKGEQPDSYDPAFVAAVLQLHIRDSLIHQEVDKRKLAIDDTCRAAARQDTYASLGSGNVDKGKQIFDAFSKEYQDTKLRRDVESLVLQSTLANMPCQTANAAQDYFNAHPEEFEQSCLLAIVTDAAQGDTVFQQLTGGADFATVAQQVSKDPSKDKGGDVGCRTRQEIPPDLTAAAFSTPVGQVASPVPTTAGAVILKVVSRQQSTFADVQQQAAELAATAANSAFSKWLQDAVTNASVTIDPRYGTWNQDQKTIDPPGATTTTSPAIGSQSSSG